MTHAREVFSIHRYPPGLNSQQEIEQLRYLSKLRKEYLYDFLPTGEKVDKLVMVMQKDEQIEPTLPNAAAYATETIAIQRLHQDAQSSIVNLPNYIATTSARTGAKWYFQDLLQGFEAYHDLSSGNLNAIYRLSEEERGMAQLFEVDKTGVKLAEYLKMLYEEPTIAVPEPTMLNYPCFVEGAALTADFFIQFVLKNKSKFGFK